MVKRRSAFCAAIIAATQPRPLRLHAAPLQPPSLHLGRNRLAPRSAPMRCGSGCSPIAVARYGLVMQVQPVLYAQPEQQYVWPPSSTPWLLFPGHSSREDRPNDRLESWPVACQLACRIARLVGERANAI
jgi:hypothetical protein